MKPKTIAILVVVGLFLIVLLQNTQVVTVRVLFWKVQMSRIILLPLLLFVGFIAGYLVGVARRPEPKGRTEPGEAAS